MLFFQFIFDVFCPGVFLRSKCQNLSWVYMTCPVKLSRKDLRLFPKISKVVRNWEVQTSRTHWARHAALNLWRFIRNYHYNFGLTSFLIHFLGKWKLLTSCFFCFVSFFFTSFPVLCFISFFFQNKRKYKLLEFLEGLGSTNYVNFLRNWEVQTSMSH